MEHKKLKMHITGKIILSLGIAFLAVLMFCYYALCIEQGNSILLSLIK